tara:strand:+ start:9097 stop:14253 length:5157 start_codon:yes stop_codon:yes gene_type:complete
MNSSLRYARGLGAALLPLALHANADVESIDYLSAASGKQETAQFGVQYLAPKGQMTLYLVGGLERRLKIKLVAPSGAVAYEHLTDMIGPGDRITVDGRSYYGFRVTVPVPEAEGEYELLSAITDLSGAALSSKSSRVYLDTQAPFEPVRAATDAWTNNERLPLTYDGLISINGADPQPISYSPTMFQADQYDYGNSSAEGLLQLSEQSWIKLSMRDGLLYYINVHDKQYDPTGGRYTLDLDGLPEGAAVVVSDDRGEFSMDRRPQGQWSWADCCTDGGVFSIPFDENEGVSFTATYSGAVNLEGLTIFNNDGEPYVLEDPNAVLGFQFGGDLTDIDLAGWRYYESDLSRPEYQISLNGINVTPGDWRIEEAHLLARQGHQAIATITPTEVTHSGQVADLTFQPSDSLPASGDYELHLLARDSLGNEKDFLIEERLFDVSPPEISILKEGEPFAGGTVNTLDQITFALADDLDDAPAFTEIRLSGGPNAEDVYLTASLQGDAYRLEYPMMLPTIEQGAPYTLSISARDTQGNVSEQPVSFSYDPPVVELAYGDGDVAMLPAINQPFYRPGGHRIIESLPLELRDGSLVSGTYQLTATLQADSDLAMVIDGKTLQPGDTTVLSDAYDFSANGNAISVNAYPLESGRLGTSTLMVASTAPNSPVLMAKLQTWEPDISLSASSWSVKQLVGLVDIQAVPNQANTCRVTMEEDEARQADPIVDPVCLLRWVERPQETSVVTAGAGENHISKLYGHAIELGDQQVSYELSLFSASGEQITVGEGSETLTVTDASDTVQATIVPKLADVPRLIRPVSGVIREASDSSCAFFTTADAARDYSSTREEDSAALGCYVHITHLPAGFVERPGAWPGFDGAPEELGEQTIEWQVTAFSRTGAEVILGEQAYTFNTVEPITPAIDLLTDSSSRRAFTSESGEDGAPEFELYTVPYGDTQVGQVFYRSAPGGLSVSVSESGNSLVDDEYGVPSSSRERLLMSRVMRQGDAYPLWTELVLDAHAEYTEHPAISSDRSFTAYVVPDEKVQPYLQLMQDGREILNTDTTRFQVQVRAPRDDEGYSAERMGEWKVRIVEEQGTDDYLPLTDYRPAEDGLAEFELSLDVGDSANVRLKAEAVLASPIPAYSRTVYSSSPVYVTVLEGNPLDAELETQKLSGEAPYRGLFQVDFDTSEGLRASGDIEWRLRRQGHDWEIDPRDAEDRLRLRKEVALEEPGDYFLEATVTNRYSGAKSVTERAHIVVYEVPQLELAGARTAFVGDSLTLEADVTRDGQPVDIEALDVEWSIDLGRTWSVSVADVFGNSDSVSGAQSGSRADLTLARDEEEAINVWVRVKEKNAPYDDRYAWVQESTGVSFREIKPVRVFIDGPNQVESGVEYSFEALVSEPYNGFNRGLEGYFTLPDGTQVNSTKMTYTPNENDLANGTLDLLYTGWAEGFRDTSEARDTFSARVWKYIWPQWGIYDYANASVAPAEVLLRIRQVTRSNRLEGVAYSWELSPDFEVNESYSDLTRKLLAPEPGDYRYRVVITDARGHETVLEDVLTYGEPEPYLVEQRQYFSNRYMRSPLEISVSPLVSGGHPRDRVSRFEFEVDGVLVEDATRYLRVPLTEGEHEVTVRMVSDYGEVAEQVQTVTVVANQPPVCDLRFYETTTGWRYRSDCQDADGRVSNFEWQVNDEPVALDSYGLSISKGQYPQRPTVRLRGIDDSGDYSVPVVK